jgi:hypothetical protein
MDGLGTIRRIFARRRFIGALVSGLIRRGLTKFTRRSQKWFRAGEKSFAGGWTFAAEAA